jgi:hypothetical protein
MPDISMCKGGSCPLRLHCYRYTAEAEELGQSYFVDPPYKMSVMLDDNDNSLGVVTSACAYFWNNAEYKRNEEKSTN